MRTNDVLKGIGVIGAAVAAYFLFEPRKGAQRRKKLVKTSRDLYEGAGEEIGRLGGEIGRLSGSVTSGFSGLVDKVGVMTGLSSPSTTATSAGRRRTGTKKRRASHAATNGEA